jgi:hypothetical protein
MKKVCKKNGNLRRVFFERWGQFQSTLPTRGASMIRLENNATMVFQSTVPVLYLGGVYLGGGHYTDSF